MYALENYLLVHLKEIAHLELKSFVLPRLIDKVRQEAKSVLLPTAASNHSHHRHNR